MAVLLLLWGASGFFNEKVVLGKGGSKFGFHGAPAWLIASAVVCGALLLLLASLPATWRATVAGAALRWVLVPVGWSLLAAAVLSQAYVGLVR